MTATYSLQDNTLTEQPGLDKPEQYFFSHKFAYEEAMAIYRAHLATLRTIHCSPECRGLFEIGKVYEEGKDYEIKGAGDWKWCYHLEGKIFAAPVVPVKSEDDFLESIDSMDDASRIFVDKSMAIANRVVEVMEMKGLKQKDLAQIMDKTEAEISRMLGGMHNLTLRMIAKIEAALEYDIICIPEAK